MMMAKKAAMSKGGKEKDDLDIDDAAQKEGKTLPANGHASSVVPDLIPGKKEKSPGKVCSFVCWLVG